MYKDSKSMTKRLTKAVAVLLLIMIALVGTIVGLTAHVVEEAKETKTDSSGITTVKGTNQPTAVGSVVTQASLTESFASSADELDAARARLADAAEESEARLASSVAEAKALALAEAEAALSAASAARTAKLEGAVATLRRVLVGTLTVAGGAVAVAAALALRPNNSSDQPPGALQT